MKTKSLFIAAATLCASPILHADSITIEGDLEVEEKLIVLGDDGVVFKGDGPSGSGPYGLTIGSGSIPDGSDDVRFMWYPAKGALRFGAPMLESTNRWQNADIGFLSVASGFGNKSSGDLSTAFGVANTALGVMSFVMGYDNTASNWGSTAWGESNTASEYNATAWGMLTTASGSNSTAWGLLTTASGNYSTAWGESYASHEYSTAWGLSSATNFSSTAWGAGSTASGYISTAWGVYSTASGSQSTAWGESTSAQSYLSTALGRNNIGGGHATNWVATDPIIEVGIGGDGIDPANALTVLKNGNVGIGDHQPDELLVVAGNARVEGTSRFEDTMEVVAAVRIPQSGDLLMGDFTAGDDPSQ